MFEMIRFSGSCYSNRISGGMRMKVSQSGLDEIPVWYLKSWVF